MKKLFVILFAGVLLSTGVAYAATTTQEVLLAQMIGLLKSIGENLALLITNTGSKTDSTSITGSTESVGTKTPVSGGVVPTPTPKPMPAPVAGSPFQVTNPSVSNDVAWKIGSTYSIEWNTTPTMGIISNTDYVDIYLVTGSSKTPIYKIGVGEKNAGKIKWTIPESVVPGEYAVAVQSFANPLTRAYSGTVEIFGKENSIGTGGIGGSTVQGDRYQVVCTPGTCPVSCPSGMRCVNGGNGFCSCTSIGGAGGASNNIGGGNNTNTEQKPVSSSWAVTAPVANDSWKIGTSQYIKWTGPSTYKYVTIKLVNPRTNKEYSIASSVANILKMKLWKVEKPDTDTQGTYKIKIYPYGFPEKAVMSAEFTIRSGTPPELQSLQGWKPVAEFSTPQYTSTVQPKTQTDEWLRCCTKWIVGYGTWRCCGHGSFCGDCSEGTVNWQYN